MDPWGYLGSKDQGARVRESTMKPVGKPDARNGHVRFDERGWETGRRFGVSTRAHPRFYPARISQLRIGRTVGNVQAGLGVPRRLILPHKMCHGILRGSVVCLTLRLHECERGTQSACATGSVQCEERSMKAVAVYPARHAVDIVDIREPRIAAPTQVKLRMLEVGVCGTDKDICAFAYGTPPPGSDHLVLGHESLGEVVEAGLGVADLRVGDLVVSTVRLACSDANCAACRAGHYDFCVTGNYREHGIKELDGFMTEFVVEDRHNLHPVARELRDVAVLVEPLTIAEKALIEVREIQQRLHWEGGRQRAVVLGSGPVGLLGAMVLVNAGYETY